MFSLKITVKVNTRKFSAGDFILGIPLWPTVGKMIPKRGRHSSGFALRLKAFRVITRFVWKYFSPSLYFFCHYCFTTFDLTDL